MVYRVPSIYGLRGPIAGLLARKETRDLLHERSTKTLDYLSQQRKKLRETAEGIVEKGKEFVTHRCCSDDAALDAENQVHQEDIREHLCG